MIFKFIYKLITLLTLKIQIILAKLHMKSAKIETEHKFEPIFYQPQKQNDLNLFSQLLSETKPNCTHLPTSEFLPSEDMIQNFQSESQSDQILSNLSIEQPELQSFQEMFTPKYKNYLQRNLTDFKQNYKEQDLNYILRESNICDKNKNIIKCLLRFYVDYFGAKTRKFYEQKQSDIQIWKEQSNRMVKQRKQYRQNNSWNCNLGAMKKFFDLDHAFQQQRSARCSFLQRKTIHTIIQYQLIPNIIASQHVRDLRSYLVSMKIIRIRSFSKDLINRMQNH